MSNKTNQKKIKVITSAKQMKTVDDMFQEKCSKYPGLNQDNVLESVNRIIVIGDLHGDFDRTIDSLKVGGVLKVNDEYDEDSKDRYEWIGNDTVVVQVGDQIDRCRNLPCHLPESTDPDENSDLKILKFFTDLHFKALQSGGAVYSLVGNHELMNVAGRMDYVSYENIQGFENEQPYGDPLYDGKIPDDKKNMEARMWAFEPGNPLAEFLACTRKLVLKIGSNLFVHAGILPEIAEKYNDISEMNKILSMYLFNLLDKNELEKHKLLLGPEILAKNDSSQYNIEYYNEKDSSSDFESYKKSPLWNRVLGGLSNDSTAESDDQKCKRLLNPIQKIYKVDRMFIGHTPQISKGINSACNDKLWFTDVGLSKAFDKFDMSLKSGEVKKAQVLLIENDGEPVVLQ